MVFDFGLMEVYALSGDWDNLGKTASGVLLGLGTGAILSGIATVGLALGITIPVGLLAVAGFGIGIGLNYAGEWLWDKLCKPASEYWGEVLYENFGPPISNDTSDDFNSSRNWFFRSDPLVLDLDGDGIETVGPSANIMFDHDGDGTLNGKVK